MIGKKPFGRRWRKLRDGVATRMFNTRLGRDVLINGIGSRVLSMTVDCGDHIMSFSPSDYIGRKVFRKGNFDRDHVDRLLAILHERQLLRTASTLLELGGNIGTQTIYFALSKAFHRIVSVEPDPRNFELLCLNIEQNKLADAVTPINCAAGDKEGEIDFFQHSDNHGKSSAMRQSNNDHRIVVPVKPVDTILKQAHARFEEIGLVWMDIEGYEPRACRSMEVLLARRIPLYLEFSPAFYGPVKAAEFVLYLARFYDDCLIFREQGFTLAKVAAIPVNEPQFDLLLFNSAVEEVAADWNA
ncbi:MAG: FkbM family methyltransferase [Phyllobacterium sp.]|uniref:FkbM family methyltransferase n=1 Tax=Phyllobacterium sp. TaxID=1871046 RepID=UPI0030F1052A